MACVSSALPQVVIARQGANSMADIFQLVQTINERGSVKIPASFAGTFMTQCEHLDQDERFKMEISGDVCTISKSGLDAGGWQLVAP